MALGRHAEEAERVLRRTILLLLSMVLLGLGAQPALAAGGSYSFDGGTAKQQATVRAALAASSFDWGVLPRSITVHIGAIGGSYSQAGEVYLDGSLLGSGRFAWGVVQHEFGHQVDFLLLDDSKRALLEAALGGTDWCYGVTGLAHSDYGCERFASELSWAYWGAPDSSMSPTATRGESTWMPVAQFRALLSQLLAVPSLASVTPLEAYAPATKSPHRPRKGR
jgi:hypothetical protein